MSIQVIPLPALADNYIWLIRNGRDVVVVDPGDAAPVEAYLREHGCALQGILITHYHQDHIGGVAALTAAHAVPAYGPALEDIPAVTVPLRDGDKLRLAALDLSFGVIGLPGHTLGHIAYLTDRMATETPYLFCGDTLFACGCGRLFEGTHEQMLASLDKLAALDTATRVCCAHEYTLANIDFALACEPSNAALVAWRDRARALRERGLPTVPTTIGHELQVNPFLRTGRPEVWHQLAASLNAPAESRLGAFTLMREWKNRFPSKDTV